ncbi:MAG: DUF1015 family protein [Thiotrichaceae bacterium]
MAAQRKAMNPKAYREESYNYFLSVIFLDNQMKILDYNRVVEDLNQLTPEQLLQEISKNFTVTSSSSAVKPQQSGEFGMYLADSGINWWDSSRKNSQRDPRSV